MKILSEILSADPKPVALIVFFISALCGGVILAGHPSADFVSDRYAAGVTALLSGLFGILFLINQKIFLTRLAIFFIIIVLYYFASAAFISGHIYDSVIHLVLGLSSSWVFIHQSRLCVHK